MKADKETYTSWLAEREDKMRRQIQADDDIPSILKDKDRFEFVSTTPCSTHSYDSSLNVYKDEYEFTMARLLDDIQKYGLPDPLLFNVDPDVDYANLPLDELYDRLASLLHLVSPLQLMFTSLWRWQEISSFFNCSEKRAKKRFQKAKEYGGSVWLSNSEFVSRAAVAATTPDSDVVIW